MGAVTSSVTKFSSAEGVGYLFRIVAGLPAISRRQASEAKLLVTTLPAPTTAPAGTSQETSMVREHCHDD